MTRLILISLLCAGISTYAQERTIADSDQQFFDFLETSLDKAVVNKETSQLFHQRSQAYWRKHILDYKQNPKNYYKALDLFYQNQRKFKRNNSIDLERFENQIENFRRFDNRNSPVQNPILFIGSSSIVHWETARSFPDFPVVNRGFGGASISEIIHYYDDIILKHSPSILIVYSDIDIERGKSPNEAVNAFNELVTKVRKDFPQIQIILLSMKPALVDDFLGKDVRRNKIISNQKLSEYCVNYDNLHYVDITANMLESDGSLRSDIFLSDGMHLNHLGYTLWDPVIKSRIIDLIQ